MSTEKRPGEAARPCADESIARPCDDENITRPRVMDGMAPSCAIRGIARPCAILCSRPIPAGMLRYVPEGAFIIAADAGWKRAEELGLAVDLAVGDFDSSPVPAHLPEVLCLPAEKDDTDAFFAAREAIRRGFGDIVLLGAVGGRQDHTLAALATLLWLRRQGAQALLAGEGLEARCALPGRPLLVPRRENAYLSVFPAMGAASGVRLRGVKYPLDGATLTPDVPLGVSNEFAAAQAEVYCADGALFTLTVSRAEEE